MRVTRKSETEPIIATPTKSEVIAGGFAYKEGEIGYVEYIALMEQSIEIRSSYLNALNLHNQTVNEINYLTGKYN